ncbi:membrane protein insertase YidC [Luteimonas sp. Y-2-2-4F]|nr:membrane protein insertase YidC [Luteimonas sp. Y-2-2-4F]MCD9031932.1 membrane protein insertase YidC [Luteimonas sp. Y-2-2-4F]
MNQTRTFLILAWLMVATLLWMEWNREKSAPAPDVAAAQSAVPPSAPGSVPTAPSAAPGGTAAVPTAPSAPAAPGATAAPAPASAAAVTVTSDVLRLTFDRGNVVTAELLRYPQTRQPGSAPVALFSTDPAHFYAAQVGWVSSSDTAPTHDAGFVSEDGGTDYALDEAGDSVSVPFVWNGPDGVSIRRTYTVRRGSYAIEVRDEVINQGSRPWQGFVYRQLAKVPPVTRGNWMNPDPESFSLNGGVWHTAENEFGRRKFADFTDDGGISERGTASWIALLQHHFFTAWIPDAQDETTISLHVDGGGARSPHLIRELGPGVSVAAGQTAATSARLWVGPKLVGLIRAEDVRGLDRAVDYSRFTVMAVLGEWLFRLLDFLHGLFKNWGWAIIGLVVLVKLALFPLSQAQYKSMAKMRKFQPRIQQLKERYGDDRQKFQMAMMELYKKEKINPIGGCLPILLQMPIFFALYWVLLESVELRHAPWVLWIQDLTARDPYFILPIINMAVMWSTQKLSPMTGMDPMQQRIMTFMPLVFGVIMIFFPAGLVLYWVTNGALGLLQQWWLIRRYSEDKPAKPAKA